MSERREHKRRYNQRLEYVDKFEKWLNAEPPMIRIFKWRRWRLNRPSWKEAPNE